jgi:hypothetical protein
MQKDSEPYINNRSVPPSDAYFLWLTCLSADRATGYIYVTRIAEQLKVQPSPMLKMVKNDILSNAKLAIKAILAK